MKIREFVAAYDGECSICLADVDEGDRAGYIDGEFACGDCLDEALNEIERDETQARTWADGFAAAGE